MSLASHRWLHDCITSLPVVEPLSGVLIYYSSSIRPNVLPLCDNESRILLRCTQLFLSFIYSSAAAEAAVDPSTDAPRELQRRHPFGPAAGGLDVTFVTLISDGFQRVVLNPVLLLCAQRRWNVTECIYSKYRLSLQVSLCTICYFTPFHRQIWNIFCICPAVLVT